MILPDFSKYSVLVIGDVMLDRYIWGNVQRISPEAPIPVVHIQDRTSRLGGAGNVAANLAGIGCKVTLTGLLGMDSTGKEFTELLAAYKISNACVYTADVPTVSKTRVLAGTQQIVRLDDENPSRIDDKIQADIFNIVKQDIEKFDTIVIVDYAKGLLNKELVQDCITLCAEKNIPVFIDPKKEDWSAYSGATCITPNLKEFESAVRLLETNPVDLETGASSLLSHYGLEHLIVTQGSAGMTHFNKQDSPISILSQAREVYDVSGAGDTVIALLSAGYAAGFSMTQAMELANLGAGEVVGRVGTYAVTLTDLETAGKESRINNYSPCSLGDALKMVEGWKMLGQTIVFTNGCFDVLHSGHISLLQRAKKLGNRLVVGLNSDASIRRIKGATRPILTGEERAVILTALSCVDIVVFFDEDTPQNLIKALRPDILVKGSDYTSSTVVGADLIKKWGGRIELLKLVGENSTTAIVNKIRNLETDTQS